MSDPRRLRARRRLIILAAALAGGWLLTTTRRVEAPASALPRVEHSPPPALCNPIGDTMPGVASVVAGEGVGAEVGEAERERPSYRGFLDALTREFPFGRERQAVLREMLEGAPPEAVEGLLRLTFGAEALNDVSHVLIEHLATLEPEAALAFAREKQFGIDPPWWHSVIGGLADPRLALPDLLALPVSDARTNYLGHLTLQTGLADPDAALRFALDETPPEARGTAIANAVFAAARRDYADGFDVALLYGPEAGDPALVRRIAVDWALDDHAAASARILAMEEGSARQRAVEGLAAATIARDPAEALPLIAQVRDAVTREALLVDAGKQLWLKNPAAAAAWLARTPELGAASRETLREFAARAGR